MALGSPVKIEPGPEVPHEFESQLPPRARQRKPGKALKRPKGRPLTLSSDLLSVPYVHSVPSPSEGGKKEGQNDDGTSDSSTLSPPLSRKKGAKDARTSSLNLSRTVSSFESDPSSISSLDDAVTDPEEEDGWVGRGVSPPPSHRAAPRYGAAKRTLAKFKRSAPKWFRRRRGKR